VLTQDYSEPIHGHYIFHLTGQEYMVQPLLCVISKVMGLPYPAESDEFHHHPDT
jgi:hypothetical protein